MSAANSVLPSGAAEEQQLRSRHRRASIWGRTFFGANLFGILALLILFLSIVNQAFGLAVTQEAIHPAALSDRPLEQLNAAELADILQNNLRKGKLQALLLQEVIGSGVARTDLAALPLSDLLQGKVYPADVGALTFAELNEAQLAGLLRDNMPQGRLYDLVMEEVVGYRVITGWTLFDSLFNRAAIEAEVAASYPQATLVFKSWLTLEFIVRPLSSVAADTGLRAALMGSAWIVIITIGVSFPLGLGAAIYLEEYADRHSVINRIIETNIRNLAGVPSIIYGMLGLAVFVRALSDFTSGAALGLATSTDASGRTILSAGFTLALLVLPVVIINAQEAIRAVPYSIREASYGVGATQWQTIWRQVLPAAVPGILTGVILSLSRAIGETAPLVVIGAATFINLDPNGPFSRFTALPLQIWRWTTRPEFGFRQSAAAAILVLLALLLLFNGAAIILRQRFSRRLY